jgi:type III restriction enzyme
MTDGVQSFFDRPILNSPYGYPGRHWRLDASGQPTDDIVVARRESSLVTLVPKPKKRRASTDQAELALRAADGVSTAEQAYDPTPIINELRGHVDAWRRLPRPEQWQVTPETARLLLHWRQHDFQGVRPFFCQIEAVETAIWLAEVAPRLGARARVFRDHLAAANAQANPDLYRVALKLATGAGKTTVMAMLIAWQIVNPVERSTRGNARRGGRLRARLAHVPPRGRALRELTVALPRGYGSLGERCGGNIGTSGNCGRSRSLLTRHRNPSALSAAA